MTHSVSWSAVRRRALAVGLVITVAACAQPSSGEAGSGSEAAGESPTAAPSIALTGDQQADQATLDSLVTVARSLARTEGCAEDAECAAVALGVKACGGAKEYLVYCRASTDTAELMRVVELVNRLEAEFNERYGMVSDCMLLLEPQVTVQGGACVAAGARGGQPLP